MTYRVRWVQPPDNWLPQPGHCSTTCSTRWVGVMRVRVKPWRRGWRGALDGAGFPSALGFRPGIRRAPPGLVHPSILGNPFLQPLDDGLLPGNDANQDIPVGGGEVNIRIHSSYMT